MSKSSADPQLLSKFNRQLAGGQAKDTAGARVTNFEMQNFLQSNDEAHHITDPITGQDLTKNAKLMDLQNPPQTESGQPITGMPQTRKAPMWSYGQ
jgi:hypothetical protein